MVKKEVLVNAIASAKRDWGYYNKYVKTISNPDPILKKTKAGIEKGITLFSEMKRDAHLSAVLQKRKRSVLKYSYNIKSVSSKRADKKVAEFINGEFKKIYYNLAGYILDAVPMGFSVTELIYVIDNYIGIKTVKKRKQKRFTFGKEGELRLKTPENIIDGEELPEKKFIVATYEEEDDNRYGEAVLSNCFWPWWFKKHGILFWANFLERFGQPLPVGKYPPGTTKEKQQDFLSAIEAIQTDFGIIIPDTFKIDFVEAQKVGATSSYEQFINFLDRQMSKAVLSSTLAVDEGKHGTRAQAEVHQNVSEEIVEADIRFLESVINNTILKWLIEFNYGKIEAPEFSINFKDDKATKEELEKIKTVYDMGLKIPTKYLYERTKIPEPEADEESLMKGEKTEGMKIEFSEGEVKVVDEIIDKYYVWVKEKIKKSVDFKKIGKIIKKSNKYEEAINKLNRTDINIPIEDSLVFGVLLGKYFPETKINFTEDSDMEVIFNKLFSSVSPEKAIKYLKNKIPVDEKTWKKLSDDAKASAFYIKNTSKLVLINSIKEKLLEAIEKGKTYSEFKKEVEDIFNVLNKNFNEDYIRTMFYTNIYSVINAERYKTLMQDEYTEWLTYYTANDDRVRENHRLLHGFTARKDDPVWDSIFPPNGFNCRCIVRRSEKPGEFPAKAPAEPDKGFSYNPAKANRSKLVEALKNQEKYKEYLDNAITTWIGLDRPSFKQIDINGLPEAPKKSEVKKSFDYYWREIENFIGEKGDVLWLDLDDEVAQKINLGKIKIDKNWSLNHVYKRFDRERFILYGLETLREPFEIWEIKQSGKTAKYRFIGVFQENGKKTAMITIVEIKNGVLWGMNYAKENDFITRRKGRFLYGK